MSIDAALPALDLYRLAAAAGKARGMRIVLVADEIGERFEDWRPVQPDDTVRIDMRIVTDPFAPGLWEIQLRERRNPE